MNAKINICLFLILTIILGCKKDNQVDHPGAFIKYFGGDGQEDGFDVKQTEDGGYVIVGTTIPDGSFDQNIFVIKTDKNGNKEWDEVYGGVGTDDAKKVILSSDGNFVIIGSIEESDQGFSNIYILKISKADGSIIWDHKDIGATGYRDYGVDIKENLSGDYIFVGTTENVSVTGDILNTTDQIFGKIGSDGTLIGLSSPQGKPDAADISNAIAISNNGDLVYLGTIFLNSTNNKKQIQPFGYHEFGGQNFQGVEIKDNLSNLTAADIISTSTGYTIIGTSDVSDETESTTGNIYIVKLDEFAAAQQGKIIETSANEVVQSLSTTSNGYVVVGAQRPTNQEDDDIIMVFIDENLNVIGEPLRFGGEGDDIARAVEQTSDGGFVVVGTSEFGGNSQICIYKVDANGTLLINN